MRRPGRPLGVSLAILASLFVFTVSPLMQVGLLFVVRQHFVSQGLPNIGNDDPIISGGDILGIPSETIAVQAALALVFLVAAVLAWRGRPAWMRFVMMALVVLYTAIKLITIVSQSMAQQNLQFGISSMDSIMQSVSKGELLTEFLVMVYVIWYMNRGPARAFYRGYYLPEVDGTIQPDSEQSG